MVCVPPVVEPCPFSLISEGCFSFLPPLSLICHDLGDSFRGPEWHAARGLQSADPCLLLLLALPVPTSEADVWSLAKVRYMQVPYLP